jgi:hypothetical protein
MVRSIFALAAVLSVASASLAADLVTPMIVVESNSEFGCKVLNITSAPIVAQYQMIQAGSTGTLGGPATVLYDSGPITLVPDGGAGNYLIGSGYNVFCRFLNASKSKVRAELTALYIGNYNYTYDTLVVPAQ